MSPVIYFFTENVSYKLRNKTILREWIESVISSGHKKAGNINFIFCDDDYLLKINIKYLKHRTLTDIVTFSFSEDTKDISGDIFISVTRVRENATNFKVSLKNELNRVMIHGVLHLLGYDDRTPEEKEKMREMENLYLEKLKKKEKKT